jgi:hypothetical protein
MWATMIAWAQGLAAYIRETFMLRCMLTACPCRAADVQEKGQGRGGQEEEGRAEAQRQWQEREPQGQVGHSRRM